MNIKCNSCAHSPVCMLAGQFKTAQEAVNNMNVTFTEDSSTGKIRVNLLSNLKFIKPVELDCIHYYTPTETARLISNDFRWTETSGTTTTHTDVETF